jgi:di/tricarboxylate transporter
VTKARITPAARVIGMDVGRFEAGRHVQVLGVVREGRRVFGRLQDAVLQALMTSSCCRPIARRSSEPSRRVGWSWSSGPGGSRSPMAAPTSSSWRRWVLPIGLFALGIALAASGLLPAAAAFTGVVVAMVLVRVIRPSQVYESIDWPVIVLLGAMIPLGDALQQTGAAQLIGGSILMISGEVGPLVMLGAVLMMTMAITPVLNNAATVVIMAPIVISIAERMGVAPDAFLIAVAIGASCDFLTPFGHHNNTLIMGPGGYRFGDYWRVGLGLDVVVIAVCLLVIPLTWPF